MLTTRQAKDKEDREEQEGRVRLSRRCVAEMKAYKLMTNYNESKDKEKGGKPGAILIGYKKTGEKKTVFVREYGNYLRVNYPEDDLQDYAAFTIMKQCGGRVPKVKLKGTKEKVFYFSTDVAQSQLKHPDRKYKYHEFSEAACRVQGSSIACDYGLFGNKKSFEIDKVSVARMLIMSVILNIYDLHELNTGIVFSSEGNAKLAFIDVTIYFEKLENKKELDLDGFVRHHLAEMCIDPQLSFLINTIEQSDYIEAFTKINNNFAAACKAVLENVHALPFIAEDRRNQLSKVLQVWEQNFLFMQKMVEKAKNDLPGFSRHK